MSFGPEWNSQLDSLSQAPPELCRQVAVMLCWLTPIPPPSLKALPSLSFPLIAPWKACQPPETILGYDRDGVGSHNKLRI